MYVVPLLLLFQLPQSSFHSGSHATLDSWSLVGLEKWSDVYYAVKTVYVCYHANILSYLQTKL